MHKLLDKKLKIYNITSGKSFADSLVRGILERTNGDPLELSQYMILLPSRRACRVISDAFLRHSQGKPMILPSMYPIGDVDAEEVALLSASNEDLKETLNLPPAISKLERQLLLAQLIQRAEPERNFDQAVAMALELGIFLDEVQTERLIFDDLTNLVPEEFAEHWQKTLDFLKILTFYWPKILESSKVVDIAERRNLLIEAQIKAWSKNPPRKKIIAAGSTGPIPAVTELLALVAQLPNGEVVLPGVDMLLDDESWNKINEDHPQFLIKNLLGKLGVGRDSVQEWHGQEVTINPDRVKLISEAMRPAETTDKWRGLSVKDISEHALAGISRIDCSTAQEEADTIALIMRETLETPEKTCALVTSDRRLARRVSQSLKRWNIKVDDSGGQPLTEFAVGSYLMLIAEMAEDNLSPVKLLAFLKHPLTAALMPADKLRDNIQYLDKEVLRGPRHSGGFKGLREQSGQRASEEFLNWLQGLEEKLQSFIQIMSSKDEYDFKTILEEHIKTAEVMASTLEMSGDRRLWHGEAGEAAAKFLGELRAVADNVPQLKPEYYVSIFGMLLKSNTVRPRFGTHPRLSILGQIEARLNCADVMILGGLNEGTWPKLPGGDPWMSRPMRKQFGLPAPEKEISLSAHDFAQLASAKEVILTRACKVEGTPTVPARWLLRIETVLKAVGLEFPNKNSDKYRQWLKAMDNPEKVQPISRPQPCPPVSSRPKELSVTNIEKLINDPYQIYAKYILKLKPLDDLDEDAGGAKRGQFIHTALERFIKEHQKSVVVGDKDKLLQYGREALIEMHIADEVKAYWWPRFEKVAEMFIEQEIDHRKNASPFATETMGKIKLDVDFTVTAKADRIDKLESGAYAIIDYKSGYTPSNPQVQAGYAPQLPLEGLILQEGGFNGIEAGKVEELIYWKVTGGGETPVEIKPVKPKDMSIEELIEDTKQGVTKLVEYFYQDTSTYISYPRMDGKSRYNDYEHLSRIKEWGILGEGEAE